MHVLVTEDDEATRRAVVRICHEEGHTTCWAATGEGALKLLETEAVDLVLLDLLLGPGLSGHEVAGRMMLGTAKNIPIIVITGQPIEDLRRHASTQVNLLSQALYVVEKGSHFMDELRRAMHHVAERGK